MKKLLLPAFLFMLTPAIGQNLDGSFKIIAAQHGPTTMTKEEINKQQIIKIFKNGYWISAYFGDPQKPFSGSGGGTYTTQKNKFTSTTQFYSWDSTAVGKTNTFNYKLDHDRFMQDGHINSDKYQNYIIKEEFVKLKTETPLINNSLEGVWILQSAQWEGEASDSLGQDFEEIKIYSYPRFAWAQYKIKTRQFIGAGGGAYQYDGKIVTEHIDYITYDVEIGSNIKIEVSKHPDGTIQQVSWNGKFKENWKPLQ